MNWEEIIKVILTAGITSFFTYITAKKKSDAKIKEITISKDAEIKQLKLSHQHEIDKLESEHKHAIETLELQHQLQKDSNSDEISTDLALKFLNNELNLPKIINNIEQLSDLQHQIEKLNSKNNMSNSVKEK